MAHPAYRKDIDGLRSIAVSSVVLFHAGFQTLSGGFVGVDIFFVISGYLISAGLFKEGQAGHISIARFYERRVRRIIPAYGAVVLATLIAGAFILLPSELANLGWSALAATIFAANVHFWQGAGYFAGVPISHPLLHMWSLAVEEQFYLVWPLVLLVLFKLRWERWATGLIIAGIVTTVAASELMLNYSAKTAFYMAPLRAWELLLGALLAAVRWPRLPSAASAHAVGALALVLLIAPMFLLAETSRFPGITALPSCLGAVLIIYRDDRYESFAAKLLSMKVPVFLGLISYSLYLWHWPVLSLAWYAMGRDPELGERLVLIAAMLAVATVSWRYVERPFRKGSPGMAGTAAWAPRLVGSTRAALVFGGAVLILVGAASALTGLSGGLPQRLPKEAAKVDAIRREPFQSSHGCVFQDNVPVDVVGRCFAKADAMAGRKIVLWGDSYAAQHIHVIEAALDKPGRPVIAVAATGCTPFPGVDQYFGMGRSDERCRHFNDEIFKALTARTDIERIIIGGRWSNLYGLEQPSEAFDPTARFLEDRAGEPHSLDNSLAVMTRALDRTADALGRKGVPVTFLLEPPKYAMSVRTCVARALWHDAPLDSCAITERELRGYRAGVDGIFFGIAKRHANARVYDPVRSLCADGICRGYSGGVLLTEDSGHLTFAGSRKALSGLLPPPLPGKPARQRGGN